MIKSDALSRRPDHVVDDTENDDVILLSPDLFIRAVDLNLHDTLVQGTTNDTLFANALEGLKHHGPFPITSLLSDWRIDDGLLFFKDRCYVPPSGSLRRDITSSYHNSLPAGHPGHLKTLELIRRHYWWPGLTVFVKNYVTGCAICQQMKVTTHPSTPGLIPIKAQLGALPFSQVTCDFITDLPECDGSDSLMVVVDHGSTKGVISIPCNKTIDATQTVQNYIDHVYKSCSGLSNSFLSDRG